MIPSAQWFDSHCHLDSIDAPTGDVIDAARSAGVASMVTVGTDLPSSRRAVELAESYDSVWAAVGVHPHESASFDDEALAEVVSLAGHPRVVAIGEIGLDYYREFADPFFQKKAFAAQLEAAVSLNKPVILHIRESFPDVFTALEAVGGLKLVFHCFSGTTGEAQRAVDLGGYVSFAGNVSYKNATSLQQAAAIVPAGRLLVETDSPYLAPVPHRGKPNEPRLVVHVGEAVAAARGVEPDEIARATTENARIVFGIA